MTMLAGKYGVRFTVLENSFTSYGHRFERVAYNPKTRMYCYRRTTPEGSVYFEVFRPKLRLAADGKRYDTYPSVFGFGQALCIRGDEKGGGR